MNYGELKAAVAVIGTRSDMLALMPMILSLAEQRIYIGEQSTDPLRLAAMEKKTTTADGSLPADYLEMKRVIGTVARGAVPLDFASTEQIGNAVEAYTYEAQAIVVSSDVSMPLSLLYYARFAPLVLEEDTNWLLTNAPAVYLSAMLIEVARITQDDVMLQKEVANFTSGSNALREADERAQFSGAVLSLGIERSKVV